MPVLNSVVGQGSWPDVVAIADYQEGEDVMNISLKVTEKILIAIINEKTAAGSTEGAGVAREALESVKILEKAFDMVCADAADDCCPFEMTDDYDCGKSSI